MKKNRIKQIISALIASVLALAALTGCDGSNKMESQVPPYPVTVNNITVEKAPKAVASLSPRLTDMLVELGFLTKIVGFSNGEVLPEPPPAPEPVSSDEGFRWFWEKKPEPIPEPEPMPISGEIGTALEPDYDKIAQYLPEIIFTVLPLPSAQMEKLAAVNIKVMVMPAPKSIEELKQNYIAMYRVMKGQNEADEKGQPLIDELSRQLSHISSVVPEPRVTFLYVCDTVPVIATKDTYESAMLSLLGTNAAGEALNYTLTAEELVAANPDIILFPEGMNAEFFTQNETFAGMSAVKNEKLISVNSTLLFDQKLTLAESVIALGAILYPGVDFTIPEAASSDTQSEE